MHELSIALSLVRMASEAARNAGAERVAAVYLEVGAMAGVAPEALEFSFDIAAQGTPLEGAQLVIKTLPLVVYCAPCGREVEPVGPANFRCPVCQTPSAIIRQGQELDLVSLEIVEPEMHDAVS
jgi:hydrogenase nickel incorporation protein HypA/HybF